MTMIYVIILKCSELLKMNIYHKKPTFKIIFLFLSLIIDQFTLVLKLTHMGVAPFYEKHNYLYSLFIL